MTETETRAFAIVAHGDQTYGDQPYVAHLDDVVAVLRDYGYGGTMTHAGYLHDVVEDTRITAEDLLFAGFPDEVVAIVLFCTDETGHNRRERKQRTYRRVRQQLDEHLRAPGGPEGSGWVPRALRVKVADRLANVRACVRGEKGLLLMYQRERRTFREAYCVPGTADAMWIEYDRLLGG